MDYELLVEDQIDAGRTLISGLIENGFDVSVAFWVRTSEEGLWFLYLGTSSLRRISLADAYRSTYSVLRQIPNTDLPLSKIKMIEDTNPIARAAIEIRDRHPARLSTRYNGRRLGSMAIEEAYIYPRGGQMSRAEVLQTVTELMNRTGVPAHSLVTLRDGSQIQAVPMGIHVSTSGTIQIDLHDLVASTNRSIPLDDIIGVV